MGGGADVRGRVRFVVIAVVVVCSLLLPPSLLLQVGVSGGAGPSRFRRGGQPTFGLEELLLYLGDLGSKRGDLFGEFVGGSVDCSVVFGEELLNLHGDGPVELFHNVVGDYFEIGAQCGVFGAHWGLHLGGCVDVFVGISANCLGLSDILGGLEVHGVVVSYLLFSFVFNLVAGVGSVFGCCFIILVYSLGTGGGPRGCYSGRGSEGLLGGVRCRNLCSGGGAGAEERVEGSLTGVAGGHEACKRGGDSLATRAKITESRQ